MSEEVEAIDFAAELESVSEVAHEVGVEETPQESPKKVKPANKKPVEKKVREKKAPEKKAPEKKAPDKKVSAKSSEGITPSQAKVLVELKDGPKTGKQLSEVTGIHNTAIGNVVGYRNEEINSRPVHANNLLNRGYVSLLVAEEGTRGFRYQITSKGKAAIKK